MELAGIALDTELLGKLSGEMALEIKKIEKAAASLVERKFNLNSPKQLSQILFEISGFLAKESMPAEAPSKVTKCLNYFQ